MVPVPVLLLLMEKYQTRIIDKENIIGICLPYRLDMQMAEEKKLLSREGQKLFLYLSIYPSSRPGWFTKGLIK